MRDGSRKLLGVSEVVGMESEVVTMQEIMRYTQRGVDENQKVVGEFCYSGVQPMCFASSKSRHPVRSPRLERDEGAGLHGNRIGSGRDLLRRHRDGARRDSMPSGVRSTSARPRASRASATAWSARASSMKPQEIVLDGVQRGGR